MHPESMMAEQKKRVEITIPGVSQPIPIAKKTHDSLVQLMKEIQRVHRRNELFRDKLRIIDRAYACYTGAGEDAKREEVAQKIIDSSGMHFTTPVVLSQVDSIVAFLSELYLSGYPIFPVVAPPDKVEFGEALEAIIDNHSIRGRWPRQLNKMFRDGGKYNICGIEIEWAPIGNLTISKNTEEVSPGENKPSLEVDQINRMWSLDMYNTFWDQLVDIPDVAEFGDYIGFNALFTRGRMKKYISDLDKAGEVTMNVRAGLESLEGASRDDVPREHYWEKPIISNFNIIEDINQNTNWLAWATGEKDDDSRIDYSNKYLFTKFYARIVPDDHDLNVPDPNTPQIWKFVAVNNSHIIHMKKVISAFDMFPMHLGQYTDDGFRMQTKSVAEQQLAIQDATTELVNIRLNSARRAISDRAIYNPALVDPVDANSRLPAAKIPIKQNLKTADLRSAYLPIPFDDGGTASAFNDIFPMLQLSEFMGGLNSARQGAFRRGNRTLGEFSEIMSNSDMRSRMIALMMEYQIFTPVKNQIKGNILLFQKSDQNQFLSNRTDKIVEVNLEELRSEILDFKVADGYLPTSLLANTEAVTTGFQLIGSSPLLAAGFNLPGLFTHMMSLIGMRGLDKFRVDQQQQQQNLQQAQAVEAPPPEPGGQPGGGTPAA